MLPIAYGHLSTRHSGALSVHHRQPLHQPEKNISAVNKVIRFLAVKKINRGTVHSHSLNCHLICH